MVPLRFVQTRGTPARFNFNRGSGAVLLAESSGTIEVRCVQDDAWYPMAVGESVPAPLPYEGLMSVVSDEPGAHTAVIQHAAPNGQLLDEVRVELLVMHVRVDVDADRDGAIGDNEAGKRNWVWGKNQRGAIVLVNNDRDTAEQAERSELVEVAIRPTRAPLPDGCELVLAVTEDEARRISLYRVGSGDELELLLGIDPARPGEPARLDRTRSCRHPR